MEHVSIMDAWARNRGFLDIEELLNSWPYCNRLELHMHVVLKCKHCGRETVDEYWRLDPDFLAWQKCCRWCAHEVYAARVIPFNLWRDFRSVSFAVNTRCWQCGVNLARPADRHPFILHNGTTISLCRRHRIAYQRHVSKMAALADVKRAAIAGLKKHWYKWPDNQLGDSFTLASNSTEAFTRFTRENDGDSTGVTVVLATPEEVEERRLYNWIF